MTDVLTMTDAELVADRHRLLSRTVLDRVADVPKPVPISTPVPVPTPAAMPAPAPASDSSLAARMA